MIENFKRKIKMRLLTWVVKRLFNGVMEDDIFKTYQGKLVMEGEFVSEEVALKYKDQAIKILEMEAWKEVMKNLKYESNKRMYEKSEGIDDMFFGKAMLLNLDLINKYLQLLSKIKL